MSLNNYIMEIPNLLPLKTLSALLRFCNDIKFEDAKILEADGGETTDKNIRRTQTFALSNESQSLTAVHWNNLLNKVFRDALHKYMQKFKFSNNIKEFSMMEILKYEDTGFYTWHTDHDSTIPRTLTMIYLLNNDYEGGQLQFLDDVTKEEHKIKVEANKLILFPSNFMFPHRVTPVSKSTRYSIVLWAL